MSSVKITLKQNMKGDWYLYSPKGIKIGGPFSGSQSDALDWGRVWISGWDNWTINLEENNDEKKDGILK